MTSRLDIDHHWEMIEDQDPICIDIDVGFVYAIINKLTYQIYYGRKQYWRRSKRQWRYDPNWCYYTGSSKLLSADIERLNRESFSFRILASLESKSAISVGESTAILTSGSLLAPDKFYNRAAPAIRGRIHINNTDKSRIIRMIKWVNQYGSILT